ncbi:MAG: carboxy terminal-processing peptidase [Lysobacteraceae bacterium]
MKTLLRLALVASLLLPTAFALAEAPAARKVAATPVTLAPTELDADTASLVVQLLSNSRYHYQPLALDDALSEKIHDSYLELVDRDKLFLLASDVAGFSAYRDKLDDALRERNLKPAFDLFNLYMQRVGDRTHFAREVLKQDFSFTSDERYDYDREKATWATSAEELDALWRKRVKNDVLRLKLAGKEMSAIRETLDKRYANFEKRVRAIDADDVFQTFMNAYAGAIEPHTSYMNPRTTENFNMQMRLSLEGIGAVLQTNSEDITVIRSIVPGGPAAREGTLKPGDRIHGVGQGREGGFTDVVGWRTDDIVDLIRGPKDTFVRLDVVPADAGDDAPHQTVLIARGKVKLEEQAAKKAIVETGEGDTAHRIGVIDLPTFYQDFEGRRRDEADYRSATRDVAKLIEELKQEKVDGIVIDLRNNGGGSLNEAIELTGLFVDTGPVVQVRDARERVQVQSDITRGTAWDGPLAVLVNRASASASEIFAAAIQDYGRGLVIGETTFGKGTVQNLLDLNLFVNGEAPGMGQLKMTVAQFFRIDGGSTQLRGVAPDLAFPVTLDAEDYGESSYDNALPWTKIAPARYAQVNDFKPLLPLLEARHAARAKADQEFIWWSEDVAEYRKRRKEKTISLNEETRRTERNTEEARRIARNEARKAAGLDDEVVSPDEARDDGLQADERDIAAEARREEERKLKHKPDVLAREAAHVLADAIDMLRADRSLAARVQLESPVEDSAKAVRIR